MGSLFTSGSGLGCLLRVTEGFRKLRIFADMKIWLFWFLAGLVVAAARANQLDLLINYVKSNGPNPGISASARKAAVAASSSPVARGSPSRSQGSTARNRGPVVEVPPIPFAVPADTSIGVVGFDLPQPRQPTKASRGQTSAKETPQFKGLPFGARQVGGSTVITPRRRVAPAPLSQVQAPVFLSTQFPNPLNDIDPSRAPVAQPQDSFRHTLQPGNVPRPVPVRQNSIHQLGVLTNQKVANNQLAYNRLTNNIFQQPSGLIDNSQQRNGQHVVQEQEVHLSQSQRDEAHRLALEKHFREIEKIQKQQQLHQQRFPQTKQQFQQEQLRRQNQQQQFQPLQQQQFQSPQQQTHFSQPKIHIPEGHFDLPQHSHQQQQLQQHQQQQHNQQPAITLQRPGSRFNIPGLSTHQQHVADLTAAQQTLGTLAG